MAMSRTWIAILVFALAVRLAAAWYWQDLLNRSDELLRFGDSQSYWTIAQRVANGEPYQYGSENSKIFRATPISLLARPFYLVRCTPIPFREWASSGARYGLPLGRPGGGLHPVHDPADRGPAGRARGGPFG